MAHVTAREIAEHLGISAAAVSMALNGKRGVSEETRERVLAEAGRHGYSTPRAHRAKKTPPVKTISFVIYVGAGVAAQTSFSTFVLQGVDAAAKEYGYRVLVHYFYSSHPIEQQLQTILADTSGVVLLGTDITHEQCELIMQRLPSEIRIPAVVVDNFLFASYVDCVGNDNMLGARSAVTYLLKCGHRKIGYIRSKQRIANFEDRDAGIRIALEEHDHLNPAPLQVVCVDIASEIAYSDMCRWLDAKNVPATAFFAENDVLAAAAIRALILHGYRVPEDVSIIGFDDVPICEMVSPNITTMHSFKERLGEFAVSLLHRRIQSGDTVFTTRDTGPVKIAVATQVEERDSVLFLS